MTDREIFRQNFRRLLRSTGVSQRIISEQIGVSFQTVSAWATGRGYPRADAMEKLCKFFKIKQSALTEDPHSLKSDERILIEGFRSLPESARKKMIERMEELAKLYPKWSDDDG